MQDTQDMWGPSLGREDPLEEGMATHSSILAWRIPMDRGWGCKELDRTEQLSTALLLRLAPQLMNCLVYLPFTYIHI